MGVRSRPRVSDPCPLVVFGCGGNRDRTKRPLMVRAVQERADYAWATADNPRSEPLAQIFADMRAGVESLAQLRPRAAARRLARIERLVFEDLGENVAHQNSVIVRRKNGGGTAEQPILSAKNSRSGARKH